MKKIGLFGGAFDPIHLGHTDLANAVLEEYNLDEVIFIPSKNPPHKMPHIASPVDRLNMISLAIKDMGSKFSISDSEILSENISYTYNTIQKYNNKNVEIYFICGSDIFSTIETWYNWQNLLDEVKFIIVERANFTFEKMFSLINFNLNENIESNNILLFKKKIIDISSTKLRQHIESQFFNKNVFEYIKLHKLYEGSK